MPDFRSSGCLFCTIIFNSFISAIGNSVVPLVFLNSVISALNIIIDLWSVIGLREEWGMEQRRPPASAVIGQDLASLLIHS